MSRTIEHQIEHAIRTTLVVLNKQSIDIAVEKIKAIIQETPPPPKSAEEKRLDISHKYLGFMAPRSGYNHTERLDKAMQEYAEWYTTHSHHKPLTEEEIEELGFKEYKKISHDPYFPDNDENYYERAIYKSGLRKANEIIFKTK